MFLVCKDMTPMWMESHVLGLQDMVLMNACRYVVLAKADSDQITLLNLTAADKKLADLSEYKDLLQNFITQEVNFLAIRWVA